MKYLIIALALAISIAGLSAQTGLDPRYHTYDQMKALIDSLEAEYPELMKVDSIGATLGADPYQEPLPIWAVKLATNVHENEDRPAALFVGQVHAEEVLGYEASIYMIQDILENSNVSPYSHWLNNLEIWIVPSNNPEGLHVVMDGWDVSFRKNKRDNNLNGIFDFVPGPGHDIDGVDLNRNFAFNWVHGDTLYHIGPGTNEPYDYYRGPAPFSEGGNQALKNLSDQQHFVYSIVWHSSRTGNFAEKLFYPFEHTPEKKSPDFNLIQQIGTTVANLIIKEDGSGGYEPLPSTGRRGNAHDWYYQQYGTIQFLVECGTSNIQPGGSQVWLVDDTAERNLVGAYYLLNRLIGYQTDRNMLRGHVLDAVTGEPVVAEVIVEERHAPYFAPRYTDSDFGRFWRPLSPGSYTLRIRQKGYEEKVVENVVINQSSWTNLTIELQPIPEAVLQGNVTSNGDPIAAKIIMFDEIENDTLYVDSSGMFSIDTYAGDIEMLILADGHMPRFYEKYHSSGVSYLDFEMHPEEIYFEENWESGFSQWEVQGPWNIRSEPDRTYVRDNDDQFYQNNINVFMQTTQPINLQGVSGDIAISFEQKYYTEHGYDFCYVEVSTDGSVWEELASYSGIHSAWHSKVLPLENYRDTSIYLRFRLETDATLNDPGWSIGNIKIVGMDATSTDQPEIVPSYTKLYNNYPNPFNPYTNIRFSLAQDEHVKLEIFNARGQKVRTLLDEEMEKSNDISIKWNGKDDRDNPVASGIYFYRLKAGSFDSTKKMLLMK